MQGDIMSRKKKETPPGPKFLPVPPVPDTTITAVDVAFPASVQHLMPRREDIPNDYPRRSEWRRFQADWFAIRQQITRALRLAAFWRWFSK